MLNIKLCFALFTITLGSSFQFGYQTGVINAPQLIIQDFIKNVTQSRGISSDETFVRVMLSLCVSGFLVGGLIGAISGGYIGNHCGRKKALFYLAIPSCIGSILMMCSQIGQSFELIICGRFLVGFSCGSYTVLAPTMLSELAPLCIRGAAGVLNQLVIVFAVLLSQLLGLPELMGSETLWPYLLGLNILPCVVQVVCLLFCPESPRYLYLIRRDLAGARKALNWLRGPDANVESELREMDYENEVASPTKIGVCAIFGFPHLRLAVFVAVVAQMSQQFSGINGLLYYSTKLFEENGLSVSAAAYATLGIGAVNLVVTLISIFVIDLLGRRRLLLIGLTVMLINLSLFTISLIGKQQFSSAEWLIYLAIVAVYLFVAGFATGPGSIPWFVVAEMFTQESRDAASSIAIAVNWLCNIAVGLLFPQLLAHLREYSFVPFIVILLTTIILLACFMPETKGRSSASVEADFKRRVGVFVESASNSASVPEAPTFVSLVSEQDEE